MLTTPLAASAPYKLESGPRYTSAFSRAVVESEPKSNPPPRSPASTPSTRTLFDVESPPRTNSEVTAPICPDCTTNVPGIMRNSSTRLSRSARSCGPSTLVAALVCACGVGVPVAVTTIDSRTHSGSITTFRST